MNCVSFLVIFTAATPFALAGQADTNPLSKAIELLDSLAAKVTAEADAAAKAYQEYEAWCHGEALTLKNQVQSGESHTEALQATITKTSADIMASDETISSLAGSISTDNQERQEATAVRAKESADFAASEAALVDAISTLGRATVIVQREMQKNPAAFAQVDRSNVNKMVETLSSVVDAASFPAEDQKKLLALAQTEQNNADGGELSVAPAYKSHSESISDMLEDLKEKAEAQLNSLRKAEHTAKDHFLMLENSLSDQIDADTKDMNQEKSAKASSQETKSVASGDLAEATGGLNNDKSALATAGNTCRTAAADNAASVKSRSDELGALATAKKILSETTSGAESRSYSFLEVDHTLYEQTGSRMHSRADLANAEIVSLLKKIAKENHSAALAQLASKIAATLRFGAAAGQDPFTKVKALITDMIAKLQSKAQSDMTEKSYCDSELAKSNAKHGDLDALITKLSTKIDQATAASAQDKADVTEDQSALAKIARSQAEMDSMRSEGRQEYAKAKADLELGLEGVRKVIVVLKEYYGGAAAASASMLQGGGELSALMHQPAGAESHVASATAGGEVVNELEIVESDFARDMATEERSEADAQAEYETMTRTNNDSKRFTEQDVKFETKEFKGLDKSSSDLSGDKETTGSEDAAVLEYSAKLKERCIGKAETYETRTARREAEIQGLKEAMSILDSETAFVQRKKHGLRGMAM